MIQKKFQYLVLKLAGLGIMIAACAPYASALAVTYTTTGVLAITYNQTNQPGAFPFTDYVQYYAAGTTEPVNVNNPQTPASVTVNVPANPGFVQGNLGDLEVIDSSGTAISPTGTFTLTIDQLAPPGVGTLGASFSGTISRPVSQPVNVDTLELTFSNTSVNIAGIEYTLTGLTGPGDNVLDLNGYDNPLTADISQLPEPTLLALTGFGFAGLCFVAYRRRRTA
jgi:hypothetical protein